MNIVRKIIFISRPYLWVYTIGSALIGFQAALYLGYDYNNNIIPLLFMLTVPVNIFIFALNDLIDEDTDAFNPKKQSLEFKADVSDKKFLCAIIFTSSLLIVAFSALYTIKVQLLILLWFLLVISYNLPPFRLKARPGLDMLFSVNFPLWGIIAYVVLAGTMPSFWFLFIISIFAFSMHLYSALHDIEYDRKESVITSAVWLGSVKSGLWFSFLLLLIPICFLLLNDLLILSIILSIYPFYFLLHFLFSYLQKNLLYSYKIFIVLHYLVGTLLVAYMFAV